MRAEAITLEDQAIERFAKRGAVAAPSQPPTPLPSELLPVEPFPVNALPEAFRPYVSDVSERMNCPPDFVGVPMLVAGASLAGRVVGIRPQQQTDWTETGNLWGMLIGRPGLMKSPAMAQALAMINRLEANAASTWSASQREREALEMARKLRADDRARRAKDALKKIPDADVTELLMEESEVEDMPRQRYIVADASYESLGEILAANPNGVLCARDELRGLLSSLSREEQATARAFYLQAWSGGPYTFDRILRGHIAIPDLRLSLIGGIQPGPLAALIRQVKYGAADDGMLERFVFAYPDDVGGWRNVDRSPDSAAKDAAWNAFALLDQMSAATISATWDIGADGRPRGTPYLRLAPDASEAFVHWRGDLEASLRSPETEGYDGALSKFRHHVPALALLIHLADGGHGPVSLDAMLRALALADYFASHMRRVWGSSRRDTVRAARKIVQKARAGSLPDPFSARNVYRNQWSDLSDKRIVEDALDMLAELRWVLEATLDTGGRPMTVYSLTDGARNG